MSDDGGWPELTQDQIDMEAARASVGSTGRTGDAVGQQSDTEKRRLAEARGQPSVMGAEDAHVVDSDGDGWPAETAVVHRMRRPSSDMQTNGTRYIYIEIESNCRRLQRFTLN